MSRILYIGPSCDFTPLLARASEHLKIDLDFAFSVKEAEELNNQNSYDAYLVCEPDSDLATLFRTIREKHADTPIAVVMQPKEHSHLSYFQLKEDLHIPYVLEVPIQKEEIEALLKKLAGGENGNHSGSAVSKIPPDLKKAYDQSITQKIVRIEELVGDIKANPNLDSIKELKQEIHKIAGSAGSFGYPKVGELCRAWEAYFVYKMGPGQTAFEIDPSTRDTLDCFLRLMKLSFQFIYPVYSQEKILEIFQLDETQQPHFIEKMMGFLTGQFSPEPVEVVEETDYIVYLVTTDRALTKLAHELGKQKQINVIIETDPKVALRQLSQHTIKPTVLIIEKEYPESIVTMEQLVTQAKTLSSNVVLVLDDNDLEDHLQALKQGVNFILNKPVSIESLTHLFESFFPSNLFANFKVLVVDDDPHVCAFIVDCLKEIGMPVETITDETKILEKLDQFHPQLLLLDINLPHHSGWELLKMIRAEMRYEYLSLVLITSMQDWNVIEKPYLQSGDEIIAKPLNRRTLQTRISQIARRQALVESHYDRNPITGYFNDKMFRSLFRKTIWNTVAEDAWVGIVLIELDYLEQFQSSLNPSQFEKIIVSSTNLLNRLIQQDSLRGYPNTGRFILAFEGYEVSHLEAFIHPFLLEARKTIQNPVLPVTFSCGIAASKKMYSSVDDIFKGAEEALTKAQLVGGNNIRIQPIFVPDSVAQDQPEIILIEDDVDVLDVLKHLFLSQNYKVITFENGTDAINYFLERKKLTDKTLIILDRRLPDMDGIEILKTIRKLFPNGLKVMFLTALSAEKDILEGLQEGALDYLTKPFNIPILLQKVQLLVKS